MASTLPKQFLRIGGKPVLQITIEKFLSASPSVKVITVLPSEWIEPWKSYCLTGGFSAPQIIVGGGITRFHSVRNALRRVPDGVLVAIHDGVRPVVSEGLISRMYDKFDVSEERIRALVPVVPSTDTLRRIHKSPDGSLSAVSGEDLDRSEIWCVQTPQMFLSEDIKAAYSTPYETSFTDDASVAEKNGIPLTFIEGERYNLKITVKEDLAVAKSLIL